MTIAVIVNILSAVVAGCSLVVAFKAFRRAQTAERRALAEAKTSAFLIFRERFQQIKHDLPKQYRDEEWLPEPDTDDWRRIELYWQNAFDEWFVPMRLNKEHLEEVWVLFFASTVRSALHYRPLRYVAWHLCEEGVLGEEAEFGRHNKDFLGVLEELWGKPLKDPDF